MKTYRRILSLSLCALLLLSVTGCTKEEILTEEVDNKSVTEETISTKADYGKFTIESMKETKDQLYMFDYRLPKLSGSSNLELEKTFNDSIQKDVAGYKEFLVEGTGMDLPAEGSSDVISTVINDRYLSAAVGYYSFTGGAHGMYDVFVYNYRIEDGKQLVLSDLFDKPEDAIKAINTQMAAKVEKDQIPLFEGSKAEVSDDYGLFYINEAGKLTIVFNQYAIAPYSSGTLYFEVDVPIK